MSLITCFLVRQVFSLSLSMIWWVQLCGCHDANFQLQVLVSEQLAQETSHLPGTDKILSLILLCRLSANTIIILLWSLCNLSLSHYKGSTWVQKIYAMSHLIFYFFPFVTMSPFIRPWCHFLQFFFYKRPCRISTTFKVPMSHFVFYPCGALLYMLYCCKHFLSHYTSLTSRQTLPLLYHYDHSAVDIQYM